VHSSHVVDRFNVSIGHCFPLVIIPIFLPTLRGG